MTKHPVLGTDESLRHDRKTEQDKLPVSERSRVRQHAARRDRMKGTVNPGMGGAPELISDTYTLEGGEISRQHHGDGDEALSVTDDG